MKIPTVIARSLLAYVKGGGAESERAALMLRAMGWGPNGIKATVEEIEEARENWKTLTNTA